MKKTGLFISALLLVASLQAQTNPTINDFLNLSVGFDYQYNGMEPDYGIAAAKSGSLLSADYGIRTNKIDFLLSGYFRYHPFNDLATMQQYYLDLGSSLTSYNKGQAWSTGILAGGNFRLTKEEKNVKIGLLIQLGVGSLHLSEIQASFGDNYSNASDANTVGFSHLIGLQIDPFHIGNTTSSFRIGLFNENGNMLRNTLTSNDGDTYSGVDIFKWKATTLFASYGFSFNL